MVEFETHPSILLMRLRETTKYLRLDSRCPGRDQKLGPAPENETRVLITTPQRQVSHIVKHTHV